MESLKVMLPESQKRRKNIYLKNNGWKVTKFGKDVNLHIQEAEWAGGKSITKSYYCLMGTEFQLGKMKKFRRFAIAKVRKQPKCPWTDE